MNLKCIIINNIIICGIFIVFLSCGNCSVRYEGRILGNDENTRHMVIYVTWSGKDSLLTKESKYSYNELYLDSTGRYSIDLGYDYFSCPKWLNCNNREEFPNQFRVKIWDQSKGQYLIDTIFNCTDIKPINYSRERIIIGIPDLILK